MAAAAWHGPRVLARTAIKFVFGSPRSLLNSFFHHRRLGRYLYRHPCPTFHYHPTDRSAVSRHALGQQFRSVCSTYPLKPTIAITTEGIEGSFAICGQAFHLSTSKLPRAFRAINTSTLLSIAHARPSLLRIAIVGDPFQLTAP